ncbi:hypothetical protein [Nonlabens xiamenensis]|uniref:hypothetical protein n=1 Tax=Nonlabens xiamenensis TaxID=2341043 RepID=UPI000F60AA7C|nr:hypothetical protein [Nonlabens xiamenensis]
MKYLTLLCLLLAVHTTRATDIIPLDTPVSFPSAEKLSEHTVRMPFELKGNLITVIASVNGATGPFIIDTGSSRWYLINVFMGMAQGQKEPSRSIKN